jgi:hypothetical protein
MQSGKIVIKKVTNGTIMSVITKWQDTSYYQVGEFNDYVQEVH